MRKPETDGQIATLERLRQGSAAYLLGISGRTLADSDAPRRADKCYSGPALVGWWVARQTVDEPDMAGPASPALEEYRREKTREAKRKNDEAEGQLVRAGDIAVQLSEIGRVFREQAAAIERIHGVQVGDAIRDMIDRAEASVLALIPGEDEAE